MLSKLPKTEIDFKVRHNVGIEVDVVDLIALGGYQCPTSTIVLFRYASPDLNNPPMDGLMEVLPDGRCTPVKDDNKALYADSGDWDRFSEMKDGQVFRLGDNTWRKMTLDEIKALVGGREFQSA